MPLLNDLKLKCKTDTLLTPLKVQRHAPRLLIVLHY